MLIGMEYVFELRERRHHPSKVARVARRAYQRRQLVHADDMQASAHRLMDVLDELARIGPARPRTLVQQNEHCTRETHDQVRSCTGCC
jgi:hypothetical protein